MEGTPSAPGPIEEATVLAVVGELISAVGDGRGLGHLNLDASLERELGLGSLERVELLGRLEARLGVVFPEEALSVADTPRQLVALARQARGDGASDMPPSAGPKAHVPEDLSLPTDAPAPAPAAAQTLIEALEHHVAHTPGRVHVMLLREDGREEAITYAALRRDAGRVAAALRRRGLKPGGKVAIMLPTSRGYFAAFMGALLAGGVPVPLYPPFRLDRIAEYIQREAKILANAEAEVLITFARAARVAELVRDQVSALGQVVDVDEALADASLDTAVAADLRGEDTALLQYTSGSTGDPKGVELTHANVLANIRAAAEGCALRAGDVMVSWLPLYHDMGLVGGWLMNLYFGTPTVILSPVTFLARPERWLQAFSHYKGTISCAPNFAFDLCVKRVAPEAIAPLQLGPIRALLNGSEPILASTLDRFAEHLAPAGFRREALFCAYGLAENMVAVTFPPPGRGPRVDRVERATFESSGEARPADEGTPESEVLHFVGCGSAVPNHEVRVADEAGAPLPDRRQGRILFRGPSAFKGYYRNPEATAKVKLADGWVDSGDLGYLVEGELFISGRVKDLIIKGGRNYYPHELEAAAGAVPGVRQGCVAAFAVRDEGSGTESIVVVAETKEERPAARAALQQKIGEAITGTVGIPPDRVVLTAPGAVPKTSSGKIRRGDTRRLYLAGELGRGHGSFARQAAGLYLRGLPRRAKALAGRAGEVAYGGFALGTFGGMLAASTAAGRLIPSGAPLRKFSRNVARATLTTIGLRPEVTGLENMPEGPCVLAPNHCSYLDPFVLLAALPDTIRFVVKGECRDNRAFGPLIRRAGHVLIERLQAERALAGLEAVAEVLRAGAPVVVFPEGTFSREAGLRPFKLGAFRLAAELGVPVVPIALRGTRSALHDGTWLPRHVPIEVQVLPALAPEGKTLVDIVRLRDRTADAIAAHIDEPRLHAVMVAGIQGLDPSERG
ncbi:AMP-binding protein [Nannocystis pusilla]|uniref:AMP-binding protein n=1 Tax=Nannocystis pusilla TaxID=889268 RepID=UPI003BF3FC56